MSRWYAMKFSKRIDPAAALLLHHRRWQKGEEGMKITVIRNKVKVMTLEEFADAHGLELFVRERSRERSTDTVSFYAYFGCCDVLAGHILRGVIGNGTTMLEAVVDYQKQISGKRLVYGADSSQRREFDVPMLTGTPPDPERNAWNL